MNSPELKAKAAYRPRRAALNWIDYLVIAATALTFVAVIAANSTHAARAQSSSTIIPASQLPSQDASSASQLALIKARIGLALAGR